MATWQNADEVLAAHVGADGRVDYEALGEDPRLATDVRQAFSRPPPRFTNDTERLAYWLNAYNVAALRAVLSLAGRGVAVARGWVGLWARIRFLFLTRIKIAGRRRSLVGIEFLNVRRASKDPRVHFALVCASKSCPALRRGLYEAARLDDQLEAAAALFCRPGAGYDWDDEGTLVVSRIFKWYRRDFRRLGGVQSALAQWAPAEERQRVADATRIRFARYDWRLNAA